MKKSNRSMRGYAFYFMLLAIFIIAMIYSGLADRNDTQYSFTQFSDLLKEGKVDTVYITPNEEVPTGRIKVLLKDGSFISFNATDITRIEQYAEATP